MITHTSLTSQQPGQQSGDVKHMTQTRAHDVTCKTPFHMHTALKQFTDNVAKVYVKVTAHGTLAQVNSHGTKLVY